MTINEYFQSYQKNEYQISLKSGESKGVKDFYIDCIKTTRLNQKNLVLKWHQMFIEYAEKPGSILWIRKYENGSKASGQYDTRRTCLVEFEDGFRILYVSNYDVAEIYNMISHNAKPDLNEFTNLMNNFTYHFHHDSGKSCVESNISCFPNIVGTVKSSVLNKKGWYYAHIYSVNDLPYIRDDGTYQEISKAEEKELFPKGIPSDWGIDQSTGHNMCKLDKSHNLSPEQKELVKAHFIRFVSPLNAFLVPSLNRETSEINNSNKSIGEYAPLISFVEEQNDKDYGLAIMDDFRKKARAKPISYPKGWPTTINIAYRTIKFNVPKKTSLKVSKPSKATKTKTSTTHFPNVHGKISSKRTSAASIPHILFTPVNPADFTNALIKSKKAKISWIYKDGRKIEKEWDATNFSASSNIRSNIQSRPEWRSKDKDSLSEVRVEII